jgi:hypothetical protein
LIHSVDSWDQEIERQCVRLVFGKDGFVFYFFSPSGAKGKVGANLKPRMSLIRFLPSNNFKLKKITKTPKLAESGSEVLTKELLEISSQMNVEELMELVAHAKRNMKPK